jgi:hypothetical protein
VSRSTCCVGVNGEVRGEGAAGTAGEPDVVSVDAGGVHWLDRAANVDDSGNRPRIAWSFRAEDMIAPTPKSIIKDTGKDEGKGVGGSSGRDAA